jgi:hypothetical protein
MKTRKNTRKIPLEVTILKQGVPSTKVLSCSFFTSKEAYRRKGEYEDSLQTFLRQKQKLKGFETRIYTDNTGKEFALKVAKLDPTVSVYYFNCPRLRDGLGHAGIFGVYIRFLPLFEPGLTTVWVSDIDIADIYLDPSIITQIQRANAKFSFRSFGCYEQLKPKQSYGRPYSILAGTIISFLTFPKQIFTKFLQDLISPSKELKLICSTLNKENKIYSGTGYKPYAKIPYGFDEYFINKYIYNYLVHHSITCYIVKDYEFAFVLLKKTNVIKKDEEGILYYQDKSLFQKAKEVFREKLPLIADKYPCAKDMLNHIDTFKDSFLKSFIKTGKELLSYDAKDGDGIPSPVEE